MQEPSYNTPLAILAVDIMAAKPREKNFYLKLLEQLSHTYVSWKPPD